nr:MAG TPA: hyaluronase tail fiber protein [Caudoviricetes sp.]
MGYTNKTSHYDLPQWIAGDKPSWLGDVNTAMLNIDTAIAGADASASAAESSAAAANAQVKAQEAKITKNTTDIQALTERLADTRGEVNSVKTIAEDALPKSGGTMTGNLILNAAPTSDLQAATKKYVDDNSGKGALMLTGGTMTGPLILSGAPTAANGAATKQYVDESTTKYPFTKTSGLGNMWDVFMVGKQLLVTGGFQVATSFPSDGVLATSNSNPLNYSGDSDVNTLCGTCCIWDGNVLTFRNINVKWNHATNVTTIVMSNPGTISTVNGGFISATMRVID